MRPTSRSRWAFRAPPEFPERLDAPDEIETPDTRTCEALAELLSIDLAATTKAMPVVKDDGTLVLALLRGDDRLEEAKLRRCSARTSVPRPTRRSWRASAPRAARSGRSGSRGRSSPTRRSARASSSPARTGPDGTCAASRRGGTTSRSSRTSGSRRRATRARVRRPARLPDRDRGRPHLQARHPLLRGVRRQVPRRGRGREADRDGLVRDRARPGARGCRRAARERTTGCVWPREISPYDVHVVVLGWDNPELVAVGEQVAESLSAEGLDVLLDDRELRPGEKFADADLIGCPLRVTVGKKTLEDGAVDLRDRTTGEESRVAGLDVAKRVVAG